MKKIVIIHTTPATIQSLTDLAKKCISDVEVVNLLDDSILKDMIEGNNVDLVEKRWLNYAEIGQMIGASAVLSACSTVGEFAEKVNELLDIPVYRIDEAMAERAVEMGTKVSVFATLNSTLMPTVSLIERKAKLLNKDCFIDINLVEGAYQQLQQGNREEHNRLIKEEVLRKIQLTDVVVLAQASMASALEGMSDKLLLKVLTSPESGMMRLKQNLSS